MFWGYLCVPFGPRFSRKEENGVLGIPLRSLWPTLLPSEPAPVNRLVVPLFGVPKRHCCRVSAADKGWWVYPLDPRPDAVALYSECTPDSPLSVTPHRSLNSCRGVISEPDLLCASETEILEELSDQDVTQCQRFGHSQTSCRGQLTCSRCASVGHASTDCVLEPKYIKYSQAHSADSKLCLKWKTEKEIQVIKTNKNIPYLEARKLIVPQSGGPERKIRKGSEHRVPKRNLSSNDTNSVFPNIRKKSRREETVAPTTSGYNLRPRIGKREESRPTIERKAQQGGPVRSRKDREWNDSPYIEERTRSSNKNATRGGDQQRQDQERRGTCTKKSLSLEVLVGNANYKS
ncbi:uncharacterized protein TNCV_2768301 [Trichonephila clavipes]|nr:uncharacterized protein TNCV_2768301 [Trichonephila clavipes]